MNNRRTPLPSRSHGFPLCYLPLVFVAALAWAVPASGQAAKRLSLRAELGAGTTLSEDLQDRNLSLAVQGSLRPGFSLTDAIAIQAAFSHWAFPRSGVWGRATLLGGGLRTEPALTHALRLLLDGNIGAGLTGDEQRVMFDVGLGLEWALTRSLGAGPAVRYAQIGTGAGDLESSVNFWSGGVGLTLRVPGAKPARVKTVRPPPKRAEARAPARDRDGDGINDARDECPDIAAGSAPDPTRAGCPALDDDKDGVFNHLDQCPMVLAGTAPDPERPGCPDGDDDSDQIVNHVDRCPTIVAGLNPDPENPGCPKPDKDGDSVPDDTDSCPDRPGAPRSDPKLNGCPGLVEIKEGSIETLKPVYFARGKDVLAGKSATVLKAVAEALKAMPSIRLLSIEGHADATGSEEFNLDLSRRRATTVVNYLVRQGVEPGRLVLHSYGKSKPAESNTTEEGRAKNRRVEFHILGEPAPAE